MAFDFSTLVTDRKQSDVAYVKQLIAKIVAGTETEAELAEWKSFTLKGSYNHTDLNRVTAAMEDLKLRLEGYGYSVPGYQRIEIEHPMIPKKLPDGYIELDYIESTGKQYIDTGYKPNQDTKVVMDVQLTSVASHQAFFSARSDDNTDTLELMWHYSGSCYRFHYDDGYRNTATFDGLVRRVLAVDKNVATVDGTDFSRPYSTYQSPNVLWLLARKQSGSPYILAKAKLYSCQIYDNGTLVHNFVPCINPNGVVGLYDTATKSFFGNSGTGAFVAGERVGVTLPNGYTQVEYIKSSGTQYIDTGVFLNNNSKVVADCEITYSTGWAMFLGSYGSSDRFSWWTNGAKISPYYGATGKNADGVTGRTTLIADKNKWSDGVSEFSFQETSFVAAHSMYLFSVNNGGNYTNAPLKLYSCQVYDNGTLVRDMIPVVRKQDEEAGLYDLVNGMFYGNAGTGAFIAGGYLPKEYNMVEYIEGTGTQYCSIPPVNTTGDFELAFDVTPVQYATWSCLLTNVGKGGVWVGKVNTGTFSLRTYSGSNHVNATLPELNKRLSVGVKCVTGTSSFYLNGVSQGTASVAYTETASCALLSDGAGSGFIGRLYSCQIYESGVLVRNFVPCVNSSNEAGLYDMVNGVFYKNAGTGTFTTGNVIPSPPQPIIADPYTWYEFDWPTPEAMTMYLLNVAAIRTVLSVLQSTPRVPLDMEKLMVQEANDIEQIVLDVYRQITIMPTTFIACGEALCGGDNL